MAVVDELAYTSRSPPPLLVEGTHVALRTAVLAFAFLILPDIGGTLDVSAVTPWIAL